MKSKTERHYYQMNNHQVQSTQNQIHYKIQQTGNKYQEGIYTGTIMLDQNLYVHRIMN